MRVAVVLGVCAYLVVLSVASPCWAGREALAADPVAEQAAPIAPSAPDHERRQFRFALDLLQSGAHHDAVLELRRFAAYYPTSPFADLSRYLAAEASFKGGDWAAAQQGFARYAQTGATLGLRARAVLREAQSQLPQGQHTQADLALVAYTPSPQLPEARELSGLAGIIRLDSLLRRRDFRGAAGLARTLAVTSPDPASQRVAAAVAERLGDGTVPGLKSPALATLLSALLPGAGQYYAGYKADARATAGSIAAYALLASQARASSHDRTAETMWLWDAGLYLGNVYGGRNAARRRNEAKAAQLQAELAALLDPFLRNSVLDSSRWLQEVLPPDLPAAEVDPCAERFARSLMAEGDYTLAGREFQRLGMPALEAAPRERMGFWRLYCLAQQSCWSQSLDGLGAFLGSTQNPVYRDAAVMLAVVALLGSSRYPEARQVFSTSSSAAPELADLSAYLGAWTQVYSGELAGARASFGALQASAHDPRIRQAAAAMTAHLPAATAGVRLRDAAHAERLSAWLPGAGQVYAGQPRRGALSFATNAGLAGLALHWARTHYLLGAAFVVWQGSIRFYDGSKYQAGRLAKEASAVETRLAAGRLAQHDPLDFLGELGAAVTRAEQAQEAMKPGAAHRARPLMEGG